MNVQFGAPGTSPLLMRPAVGSASACVMFDKSLPPNAEPLPEKLPLSFCMSGEPFWPPNCPLSARGAPEGTLPDGGEFPKDWFWVGKVCAPGFIVLVQPQSARPNAIITISVASKIFSI